MAFVALSQSNTYRRDGASNVVAGVSTLQPDAIGAAFCTWTLMPALSW